MSLRDRLLARLCAGLLRLASSDYRTQVHRRLALGIRAELGCEDFPLPAHLKPEEEHHD